MEVHQGCKCTLVLNSFDMGHQVFHHCMSSGAIEYTSEQKSDTGKRASKESCADQAID